MNDSPIFDQLNLVVSDMEATVTFYRQLGLDIPDTDPSFQAHHRSARSAGGIDLDFDSAEFAGHWDRGWHGERAAHSAGPIPVRMAATGPKRRCRQLCTAPRITATTTTPSRVTTSSALPSRTQMITPCCSGGRV
jgi:hypothetical protein